MSLSPSIPRPLVADALGLPHDTDALPPGDLPLARFMDRYRAYLATDDPGTGTADAWTGAVMDHLIADHPDLALDALVAGAGADVEGVLVDPLLELHAAAPQLDLDARAEGDAGFAALLLRAETA